MPIPHDAIVIETQQVDGVQAPPKTVTSDEISCWLSEGLVEEVRPGVFRKTAKGIEYFKYNPLASSPTSTEPTVTYTATLNAIPIQAPPQSADELVGDWLTNEAQRGTTWDCRLIRRGEELIFIISKDAISPGVSLVISQSMDGESGDLEVQQCLETAQGQHRPLGVRIDFLSPK